MTDGLLDLPLPDLMARARQIRDQAHGTRVTFSPKVFIPLTMLCRDRCGYCTFAKPPARLDAPVPHARRGARDRARGAPRSAATRRCSRSARRPRSATRRPPSGSPRTATRPPSTTSSPCAQLVLDETGLLPHANAGALVASRARAAARGQPVAGDDDRDARRPARRARRPALRRARQDPRAPARHARSRGPRRASRSPPASSSASARPAPSASTRSSRSPTRTAGTVTCRR